MGGAGGEGFVAALSGVHLQDRDEHVDVGDTNDSVITTTKAEEKEAAAWDADIRTGEFNQRSKVTEKND